MSSVEGMGKCLIPKEDGIPCSRQIGQGEPIGTVLHRPPFGGISNPLVGHKKCADAYHNRIQVAERTRREAMVQRIDQSGPGGAIDPRTARDALQGGVPLADQIKKAEEKSNVVTQLPGTDNLSALAKAAGLRSIGDIPLEATPDEAVEAVPGQDTFEQVPVRDLRASASFRSEPAQLTSDDVIAAQQFPSGSLPNVYADNGQLRVTGIPTDRDGFWHLDPDDAEDFIELLKLSIKRAWRQRR